MVVAERNTQPVSSWMRPLFSAMWMNSVAVAMRPPGLRQRSRASSAVDFAAAEGHFRLEHEQQLAGLDRVAKRLLQAETLRGRVIKRRAVECEAVAAELLGAKQRHVRGAQQTLRVVGVIRKEARADARGGCERPPFDREWLLQRCDQRAGAALDFLHGAQLLDQQRELVAAEPRDQAVGSGRGLQPLRDALQHAVAEVVPERIVQRLEVVHVDEEQRYAPPGLPGARQRAGEAVGELTAIGQLRQRVVVRQVMQLLGAFGDVSLELRLLRAAGRPRPVRCGRPWC